MFSYQTLKIKVRTLRRKRLHFASDSRPGSVLQEALQFLFQSGNWFKMTLQVNIKRQGHGMPTLAVSTSEIKTEGQSFSSSVSKWYRTNKFKNFQNRGDWKREHSNACIYRHT